MYGNDYVLQAFKGAINFTLAINNRIVQVVRGGGGAGGGDGLGFCVCDGFQCSFQLGFCGFEFAAAEGGGGGFCIVIGFFCVCGSLSGTFDSLSQLGKSFVGGFEGGGNRGGLCGGLGFGDGGGVGGGRGVDFGGGRGRGGGGGAGGGRGSGLFARIDLRVSP